MTKRVSIARAQRKLAALEIRNTPLRESFVIVKDSEPVGALIPMEEYESFLETLDILETEPDIVKKLKKAEAEIKAGKYKVWKPKVRK